MGYPEEHLEPPCKSHPNHRQQPGVCSACLVERLSKLSNYHYYTKNSTLMAFRYSSYSSSANSSPAVHSSASSSANASPLHHRSHHRVASDVLASISFMLSGRTSSGLSKSRSMVCEAKNNSVNRDKKRGFWSRLLGKRVKRQRKEVSGDSESNISMKQRVEYCV